MERQEAGANTESNQWKRRCVPCICPLCKGHLRDVRTERSHRKHLPTNSGAHTVELDEEIHAEGSIRPDTASDTDNNDDQAESCGELCENYTYECENSDVDSELENNATGGRQGRFDNNQEEAHNDDDIVMLHGKEPFFQNEKVDEFILRELRLKLKYGFSREEFIDHVKVMWPFTEGNHDPPTWRDIEKFQKYLGYKPPKLYKVCVEITILCV
ncbi:uncharacterized protein [Ptychodera flava]|uniref:uncharacterized protein n=1 Tax=Ptychodera flava TaxID=63121 RepID=UPI00396A1996